MWGDFICWRWPTAIGLGQRCQALFQASATFGQLVDGLRLGIYLVAEFGYRVIGVGKPGFQLGQTGVAHDLGGVGGFGVV